MGVRSSGKRLLSPKETAPDGEESETDKTCKVYLICAGLFLSYSREPSKEAVLLPLYTTKQVEHGRVLSTAGTATAVTADGGLQSHSMGYLTNPKYCITVI